MNRKYLLVLVAASLIACNKSASYQDEPVRLRIPYKFPEIRFPEGNEPTKLRIGLGRILFYDNRLSTNHDMNCGSCHVLSSAFTDGKMVSTGRMGHEGRRNAPTLANIAWMPRLMMEGGVPTLEAQALAPLHDSLEMGFNMMAYVDELNEDEELRAIAKAAYGRDSIDPYVVTRSLAAFQRTFISGDSRFDRYRTGYKDELTHDEFEGMRLFYSDRTKCGECHSMPFFTDFEYYNIGLEEEYTDHGKERATHLAGDIGKFKTPTLRNIELTGPYMHDGRMNTLEEVVAFFNEGGRNHVNKDERIAPMNLTDEEQRQLVAFLKTLTDWNFVQNADLLPLVK
ncbi:MAG: c-type cytochrome [Flavobacteriales bacterium]|nr:c-type cytochrome [Flavobacteriales bacterium]